MRILQALNGLFGLNGLGQTTRVHIVVTLFAVWAFWVLFSMRGFSAAFETYLRWAVLQTGKFVSAARRAETWKCTCNLLQNPFLLQNCFFIMREDELCRADRFRGQVLQIFSKWEHHFPKRTQDDSL